MGKRLEINKGDRFSNYTVIKEVEKRNNKRRFLCMCDCGKKSEVGLINLRHHEFKSCSHCRKRKINIGDRFNFLTVIKELPVETYSGRSNRMFKVKCDCGTIKKLRLSSFYSGKTKSCGCWNTEQSRQHAYNNLHKTQHGHSKGNKTRTYNSWQNMKARCNNPNTINYSDYGGRGITVCERWNDFKNFLEDMGERPEGMTLDRYPNNDGNYEPDNCRWATPTEQTQNRRCQKNPNQTQLKLD